MKTLDQKPYVPKVSFLADEYMLKDYKKRIKSYSEIAQKVLNVFTFQDGVIRGSNSFANVLLDSLFQKEYRLALPSQVLNDSELNPEFFRRNYEDLGLILRTNGDSYSNNNHNAKNLYTQLDERDIKPTEENPVRISLKGLELEEDNDSHYGLVHKLTDEAEILQAPEFSHKYGNRRFLKSDKRGVPIYLSDDKISNLSEEEKLQLKIFYARKDGLGRLCLGRLLDLDSYWNGYLADSSALGWVAVAKNFPQEI